ncbi:unnamed protein product [Symbiodinium microadriaticum]|nr:unnamed protein product [Symbiodinium sp. KB8]CAE7903085.1 unnamed protein product [Symbiodinium microadriaticum]
MQQQPQVPAVSCSGLDLGAKPQPCQSILHKCHREAKEEMAMGIRVEEEEQAEEEVEEMRHLQRVLFCGTGFSGGVDEGVPLADHPIHWYGDVPASVFVGYPINRRDHPLGLHTDGKPNRVVLNAEHFVRIGGTEMYVPELDLSKDETFTELVLVAVGKLNFLEHHTTAGSRPAGHEAGCAVAGAQTEFGWGPLTGLGWVREQFGRALPKPTVEAKTLYRTMTVSGWDDSDLVFYLDPGVIEAEFRPDFIPGGCHHLNELADFVQGITVPYSVAVTGANFVDLDNSPVLFTMPHIIQQNGLVQTRPAFLGKIAYLTLVNESAQFLADAGGRANGRSNHGVNAIMQTDPGPENAVDLLVMGASSMQTHTEARFCTLLLNPRVGGAWSSAGGGLSRFPEMLHLTVGPDVALVDMSAEVERHIWLGGTGQGYFQDPAVNGGQAPGSGLSNTAMCQAALANYLTGTGAKIQNLTCSMLTFAAGADEYHTRHSCGELPTAHGTVLD